jgi:hypothetical protein
MVRWDQQFRVEAHECGDPGKAPQESHDSGIMHAIPTRHGGAWWWLKPPICREARVTAVTWIRSAEAMRLDPQIRVGTNWKLSSSIHVT